MKNENTTQSRVSYAETLEAYYDDLVLKDKSGKISAASHQALNTFLRELRDLVEEANPKKLPKAA